ncbi:MAG: SWIB/MDM2 domain-containing protein [Parachlamydiaceae bacterium]|nr:SWIB/MDM2 domain-containing protein [Parachlamydiaceae bacterium]
MTKDKKNSAFMRPVKVTDALAEIVGSDPKPRTEITKNLWTYIKEHGLQDQTNKRMINPDEKLSKVLGGKKQINMFDMTKEVSKHIIQIPA